MKTEKKIEKLQPSLTKANKKVARIEKAMYASWGDEFIANAGKLYNAQQVALKIDTKMENLKYEK